MISSILWTRRVNGSCCTKSPRSRLKRRSWVKCCCGYLRHRATLACATDRVGPDLCGAGLRFYQWLSRRSQLHCHSRLDARTHTAYRGILGRGLQFAVAGIPASTTHVITGAIVGVGATTKLSAVRWGVAGRIVWAWVLTIPAAAGVAGVVWYMLYVCGVQ